MDKPSKYHKYACEGEYYWNSLDERLEPTETIQIGNNRYCVYCGEKAYPIQKAVKDFAGHVISYDMMGSCCVCEKAEREKELRKEMLELKQRHDQEAAELKKRMRAELPHDKKKLLDIKYKHRLAEIERGW